MEDGEGGDRLQSLVDNLLALETTFGHDEQNALRVTKASDGSPVNPDSLESMVSGRSNGAQNLPEGLIVAVEIVPTGVEFEDQFVRFILRIQIGTDCLVNEVSVVEQKGLDCASEVRIQGEILKKWEDEGDLMTLVFYAIDLADQHNSPHGRCAFCLEALSHDRDGEVTATPQVVKMSCFHCFHRDCWWKWYDWKQGMCRDVVEELRKDHNYNEAIVSKAMADLDLTVVTPVGKEGVKYVLHCPNCREKLYRIPERPDLGEGGSVDCVSQQTGAASHNYLGEPERETTSLIDLPEDVQRMIKTLQVQQKEGLQRQKTRNGLVM